MRFLIAGLGSIGRRHLKNLLDLGMDDIVLYRTHRSTIKDDAFSRFPVETSLEAALDHQPDGVIIANPTALHLDVAIPAARAGCSLLIEKPITHNLERIKELEDALSLSGGQALVGFQFRFHPTLQCVARWLQQGEIGNPLAFHAQWGEYLPGWHPWEDYRQGYAARADLGGGVVRTLCHPLDYLRWMFGEVAALWAFTGKLSELEIAVEDTAEIGLRFENGAVGTLHLDYYRRPPVHRLDITGSLGAIEWVNHTGAARIYREETDAWESCLPPEGFERNDLFLAEMRHFIDVVKKDTKPVCSLKDGIMVQKMVDAIYDASDKYAIAR